MEAKMCLELNCECEAEYICKCTTPKTYLYKIHFMNHSDTSGRIHKFTHIFSDPITGTKEAVLMFLVEERSKQIN